MRNFVKIVAAPLLVLAAACGRSEPPKVDDALRNDLSLASQAQQYRPQQFVSPMEQQMGQYGYGQPNPYMANPYMQQPQYYAPQPVYAAPAPVRERVVYRSRSSGSSSGTRVVYAEPSRPRIVKKNTVRDAVIGGVAGGAIGAVTSRDKVKGAVIGAVAGSVLGGVIGNNVDVKRQ